MKTAALVAILFGLIVSAAGATPPRHAIYSPGPNHASANLTACLASVAALRDLQGVPAAKAARAELIRLRNASC